MRKGIRHPFFIFILLFSITFFPQGMSIELPFQGDHTVWKWDFSLTMTSGDQIIVSVYYPGYRGPLDRYQRNQEAPFPVVVFSPGYGGSATDYEPILENYASYGFIVAGASWTYEIDREQDIAHTDHTKLLDQLEIYNDDRSCPLFGLVDTGRCGAFGHSRGGRVAFMASGVDNRIQNVAAWMPTLNNGSDVNQEVNKLLFGGDMDDIVSPDKWLDPLYYSSEESFSYVNVFKGDHQPTEDIHVEITLNFFRFHLLGESSLESEVYQHNIRQRAESGEFHLRIKRKGENYDSHPDLSPVLSTENETITKKHQTPFLGIPEIIIFVFFSIHVLMIRNRLYNRKRGVDYR